jgi:hypothetical protein
VIACRVQRPRQTQKNERAVTWGERPGSLQIVGGAIALAGTGLAAHWPRPEPVPTEAARQENTTLRA